MSKIVFPHISNRASKDDLEGVATTLERALYFAGALSIPGVFGAIIIGEEVLRIYGTEFTAGAVLLIVLSIARVAQSYEVLLLQTLNALDLPEITFRIAILFTVLNLGLNVILAWTIGPVGAAISTAVSVAISGGIAFKIVKQRVPLDIRHTPFFVQAVASIFMGGVVFGI
ncbi:MAG: polysaccharide biosynthesis C-terminal domain-containing protein, partial [Halobacteriaceae archaeon]